MISSMVILSACSSGKAITRNENLLLPCSYCLVDTEIGTVKQLIECNENNWVLHETCLDKFDQLRKFQ